MAVDALAERLGLEAGGKVERLTCRASPASGGAISSMRPHGPTHIISGHAFLCADLDEGPRVARGGQHLGQLTPAVLVERRGEIVVRILVT